MQSSLFRNVGPVGMLLGLMAFKTACEGAQTSVYLCVSEDVEGLTGGYYSDCSPARSSAASRDAALASAVWERSAQLLKMEPHEEVPPPPKPETQ